MACEWKPRRGLAYLRRVLKTLNKSFAKDPPSIFKFLQKRALEVFRKKLILKA